MDVNLVLTLLCAAPAGVLSALTAVDTSAPAQARAVGALLSAYLPRQRAGVLLVGEARWANALLRDLPPETPRTLLADPSSYYEADGLVVDVQVRRTVLVVMWDRPEVATSGRYRLMPNVYRTLHCVTAEQPLLSENGNTLILKHMARSRACTGEIAFTFSSTNGSTTLYSRQLPGCEQDRPLLQELDRWSSTELRWQRGAAPFTDFCVWLPPPSPADPLTLFVLTREVKSFLFNISDSIGKKRVFRRKLNRSHQVLSYGEYGRIVKPAIEQWMKCRLDAVLFNFIHPTPHGNELTIFYNNEGCAIVAFVPAGLGPAANPLHALLAEFSPAVWLGTGLAALCTAAGLACTLHRGRWASLKMALAPLLAQAPLPGPAPPGARALRPLLGVWLLVSVVLVAAYQGLLLGQLSTAHPPGEIDSLRGLEESGLTVYASIDAFGVVGGMLPEDLRHRVQLWPDEKVQNFMNDFPRAQKCGIIMYMDSLLKRRIERRLAPKKLLHYFVLLTTNLRIKPMWHRGSPLGSVVAKTIRRTEEAGLVGRHDNLNYFKEQLKNRTMMALSLAQPLSLQQMWPAFLLIVGGLVFGVVFFVLEILTFLTGLRTPHF
ncbi:Ionotropic receptor 153 [Frankliniella occidentalis]|nr:Ionotropic receptor 153 [Frankliniella occidentalis]